MTGIQGTMQLRKIQVVGNCWVLIFPCKLCKFGGKAGSRAVDKGPYKIIVLLVEGEASYELLAPKEEQGVLW